MKTIVPLVILSSMIGVVVPSAWKIAKKAGYDPKFGLLMAVSPVNLFLLAKFARSEWPVERELRLANERQAGLAT